MKKLLGILIVLFATVLTSQAHDWQMFNTVSAMEAEANRVSPDLFKFRGRAIATQDGWEARAMCYITFGSDRGIKHDFTMAMVDMKLDWYGLRYEDPLQAYAYFNGDVSSFKKMDHLAEYLDFTGQEFYSDTMVAFMGGGAGVTSPGATIEWLDKGMEFVAENPKKSVVAALVVGGIIYYADKKDSSQSGSDEPKTSVTTIELPDGSKIEHDSSTGTYLEYSYNPETGVFDVKIIPAHEAIARIEAAQSEEE